MQFSIKQMLLAILAASFIGMMVIGGIGIQQSSSMSDDVATTHLEVEAALQDVAAVQNLGLSFKTQVQEWKNILIRGNDAANFDKYLKAFTKEESKVQEGLANLISSMEKYQSPQLAEIKELQAAHRALGVAYRAALEDFNRADPNAGKQIDAKVRGIDRKTAEGIARLAETVVVRASDDLEKQTLTLTADAARARWIELGLMFLFATPVCIASALCISSITRTVSEFRDVMLRVAQNKDLTLRVPDHGRDELSLVGKSINQLFMSIQGALREMREGADAVSRYSQDMASSVSQLANSVTMQNDATASVAAAVEQMSVSVNTVAEASQEAQRISMASSDRAAEGGQVIEKTAVAISNTTQNVQEAARVVERVGTESQEIAGIIQSIKEVADQTNLLALNAAIEAARAGEQGRGFAVVADEVRKLAEKTGKLTENISDVVSRIQSSAYAAVSDMRQAVDSVKGDVDLAKQAGMAIQGIREGAMRVVETTHEIAASLKEQSRAGESVAQQVERIAQMSEENNSALGQVRSAAGDMARLSDKMHGTVAQFKVT